MSSLDLLGVFGDERLEKRGSRFWTVWCLARAFAFGAWPEVSGGGSWVSTGFWPTPR